MEVLLPYGSGFLRTEAEPERIVRANAPKAAETDGRTLAEQALRAPIGSPTLSELARGKKTAVVLISDHTRPVPSRELLPPMLRELREGNPAIDITLLVATGCHRASTEQELRKKLGDEMFDAERVVVHDPFSKEKNVRIGTLPSGAPLVLNRLAAEAELLVSEGFIEPHFFAGFSGGRKSVLPGICAAETVYGNHCGAFIDDPHARTGILDGNPIHRDMEAAARMAGLSFIVNAVLDEKKQTAAVFAGDPVKAHLEGVKLLRTLCEVRAVPGDVVVTTNGGAPLDQNLYQCVKALTTAEAGARPGATLILCAEMSDGIGGEGFYRDLRDCETPEKLYERFKNTPQDRTVPDQWQTQILCRVLMRHRVIVVTRRELATCIQEMKMEYAPDPETALSMAGDGERTVIPDGVGVIIRAEGAGEQV